MSQCNPNFIDYQVGKTVVSQKDSDAIAQDASNGKAKKDATIENVLSDIVNPLKVELLKVKIVPSEYSEDMLNGNVLFGMDRNKYSPTERAHIAEKIKDGFISRGYAVRLGKLRQTFPPQYTLTISRKVGSTEDAAPEVNRLRQLLRTNRIGKEAFAGGIATLLATGIISKSEFTRLNTLAR